MREEDIGDPPPSHIWLGDEVYPSIACGVDEHAYNGMRFAEHPKIVGTGLIALDWVIRRDTGTRIGAWAGGTCGNVLSILAYLDWDAFLVARLNGDGASKRIRCDMERWGVQLDWISCRPTADTPIIVQEIHRGVDGRPQHRFSWECPRCGDSLPTFKPITLDAVDTARQSLAKASAFFLDRLSPATLRLASDAAARGALVVFEPSAGGNKKYMAAALDIAHVVKYARDRLPFGVAAMERHSATLLEVRTLGDRGLAYRHRLGKGGGSSWIHVGAIPAPYLADTCGSGDWCTAGLNEKTGRGGVEGLLDAGVHGIEAGLRYGQALAAWNCGFEGARGGMYLVSREIFHDQTSGLLDGVSHWSPDRYTGDASVQEFVCPACPASDSRVDERTHS